MAALDPVGKRDVLNVLAQLKRRHNTTIIVAEQDPEAVAAIADRVVVLVAGQIVHQGLPQAVLSDVAALHEIGLAAPQLSELASTLRARTGQRFAFIAEAEAAAALRADLGCSPSG
jgi:energy-coupling factor transporter ATP-binding protein EcfA2